MVLKGLAAILVVAAVTLARAGGQDESTRIKGMAEELLAQRDRAPAGSIPAALVALEQTRMRSAWAAAFLRKLEALDRSRLTHDEWLTVALLEFDARLMADAAEFFWLSVPVTPYSSPLRGLTATFASMPLGTETDLIAYVDALNQLPVTLASYEARLRSQMQRGIVLPADEIALVVPYIRSLISGPTGGPLRAPADRLREIAPTAQRSFQEKVDVAISAAIDPAAERLAAFIDGPYRAAAPRTVGVGQYPGGAAYYRYLIRLHTGLDLAPEEIHAIGLREIARLTAELDAVRKAAGFTGTLAEFRTFLRTDRKFFAASADQMGETMMAAMRRIEPKVDAFFLVKPKAPFGVKRLAPALEASMTYGYYQQPTRSDPGGYYLFNAGDLDRRSVLNAAALIYHELVPGHHYQIALNLENQRLMPYRWSARYTSFTEGWGEYASDLAGEMGMYPDPYTRAGRLAMDLFLSSRLVVDTGMNALGWPRAQAIAYMRENTLESDLQVDTETLRYSSDTPGQALAYKLGSLRIHEVREKARQALGERFDIRRFHAHLLDHGSMPLEVLTQHVECFIRERHRQ